jgi:hypothetical protein
LRRFAALCGALRRFRARGKLCFREDFGEGVGGSLLSVFLGGTIGGYASGFPFAFPLLHGSGGLGLWVAGSLGVLGRVGWVFASYPLRYRFVFARIRFGINLSWGDSGGVGQLFFLSFLLVGVFGGLVAIRNIYGVWGSLFLLRVKIGSGGSRGLSRGDQNLSRTP